MLFRKGGFPIGASVFAILAASSCTSSGSLGNPTEDASASGMTAAVVGGAMNASIATGTQAYRQPAKRGWSLARMLFNGFSLPEALASTLCPTPTNGASGCSQTGQVMNFAYSGCSFSGATAVWNGGQTLIDSSTAVNCGAFPSGTGSWDLTRTFAGSITGRNATTRTSGTVLVEIDTSSGLPTYDSTGGIGGGFVIGMNDAFRTSISITGIELVGESNAGKAFDYTITTNASPLTVNDSGTTKTVRGNVTVYHNLALATGTVSFQDVVFSPGCCTPTSGQIVTTYSSSQAAYNGKSETLQFVACGSADLTNTSGGIIGESYTSCF